MVERVNYMSGALAPEAERCTQCDGPLGGEMTITCYKLIGETEQKYVGTYCSLECRDAKNV